MKLKKHVMSLVVCSFCLLAMLPVLPPTPDPDPKPPIVTEPEDPQPDPEDPEGSKNKPGIEPQDDKERRPQDD